MKVINFAFLIDENKISQLCLHSISLLCPCYQNYYAAAAASNNIVIALLPAYLPVLECLGKNKITALPRVITTQAKNVFNIFLLLGLQTSSFLPIPPGITASVICGRSCLTVKQVPMHDFTTLRFLTSNF